MPEDAGAASFSICSLPPESIRRRFVCVHFDSPFYTRNFDAVAGTEVVYISIFIAKTILHIVEESTW